MTRSRRLDPVVRAVLRGGAAAGASLAGLDSADRAEVGLRLFRRFHDHFHRSLRESRKTLSAVRAALGARRLPEIRAAVLRMEALLFHAEGRSARAATRLKQAAQLYRRCGDPLAAGDVERSVLEMHLLLGDDRRAREAAGRARRDYARAGGADARRQGSLAMNLGKLHYARDRHARALEAYRKARGHFRRAGETLRVARVGYNEALVHESLDQVRRARRLHIEARQVFERGKETGLVAAADYALAGLDLIEGRLDAGLQALEDARRRQETLGDLLGAAYTLLETAQALLRLNRAGEAESVARKARTDFRRARQPAETAEAWSLLGSAALQQGRWGRAARCFQQAVSLQSSLGNAPATSLPRIGLARARLRQGRPREALEAARTAARIAQRAGLSGRAARGWCAAAEAALALGRASSAQPPAERALEAARRAKDPRVLLWALTVLGNVHHARGRPAEAYRAWRRAEHIVEQLRRGVTTEESRLAFSLDKTELYESLIMNRLSRPGRKAARQALHYAERFKARTLAERLAAEHGTPPAVSPESRRLLERLQRLEREVRRAEARVEDPATRPGLRSASAHRLRSLSRERLKLLERFRRREPETAVWLGAPPPSLEEMIGRLAPCERVLEYVEAGGWLHLFEIHRGAVRAVARVAAVDEVRRHMDALRFYFGKIALGADHTLRWGPWIETNLRAHLEALGAKLLAPAADALEDNAVLRIVPHGPLHGLPFHALEWRGRPLVEQATLVYAPSLSVAALLNQPRREAPPEGALVLATADRHAPRIADEVATVRRLLGGAEVLAGSRADLGAIRTRPRRPQVLHIACHGAFSRRDPWASALRLGRRWVSMAELCTLPAAGELVVLSGCQTGRGAVYSGDEWVGLVRAFLQAGARAVVASLWEVDDARASAFMADFYGALSRGLPAGNALASASRLARKRDPLCLYWAPFVLIGDPGVRLAEEEAA